VGTGVSQRGVVVDPTEEKLNGRKERGREGGGGLLRGKSSGGKGDLL